MRATVIRVPATTGLPIITLGSETIIGSLIVILLAPILADSLDPTRNRPDGRTLGVSGRGERTRASGLLRRGGSLPDAGSLANRSRTAVSSTRYLIRLLPDTPSRFRQRALEVKVQGATARALHGACSAQAPVAAVAPASLASNVIRERLRLSEPNESCRASQRLHSLQNAPRPDLFDRTAEHIGRHCVAVRDGRAALTTD